MVDAIVTAEGAAKRFANGTQAVAPVDFSIARGEFVTILGPSGCGKTTLLRMIAGLVAPSRGRIVRLGRPKLGMVFQSPTLMPWSRVEANVRLPLDLTHVRRAESDAAVRDALGLVGLADCAHRYPRELSGGMQMRVSIARALAVSPSVLLMDEPFAALDEFTRHKLDDDLAALWKARSLTVVFVTHSIQEAVYLSTRVLVMAARPGRIIADVPIVGDHPRTAEYRTTTAFASLCVSLSRMVAEASSEPAA